MSFTGWGGSWGSTWGDSSEIRGHASITFTATGTLTSALTEVTPAWITGSGAFSLSGTGYLSDKNITEKIQQIVGGGGGKNHTEEYDNLIDTQIKAEDDMVVMAIAHLISSGAFA